LVILATFAMREPPRLGSIITKPSTRQSFSELFQYRYIIAPLVIGGVMAEIALGTISSWASRRRFTVTPAAARAVRARR
jgi:hypothetical protein